MTNLVRRVSKVESQLSSSRLGLGHLPTSTTGTRRKHSDSFLEVTTRLQVGKETNHNVSVLHADFINIFLFLDFYTNELPLQFGGLQPGVIKNQDPHIERDLHLSLDDLFHGCSKKIKISRRVRASAH